MASDEPYRDVPLELESLQAQSKAAKSPPSHVAPRLPVSTSIPNQPADNLAGAVLEQIYRDIISALQQMYRDTIAAKDDALRRLIAHASPISDVRGSREYREAMLLVMSWRALRASIERLRAA